MDWLKAAFLTGLVSMFSMNMALDGFAGEGRGNACRRGDRLNVEDLDVSPDPIVEGTRIRAWKVRLRFDANRQCETEITILEGRDVVAQARGVNLKPGINEIDLQPNQNYRFRGKSHCFNVQVDLEGSRREVDAARRFCAEQRAAWSMREADDRGRSVR